MITFALGALAATAHGQRGPEAERLFQDGKAEMAAGNYAVACEKFESSYRLEARASTLMNLGDCQERERKLVSAWYSFVEAGKLALRAGEPELGASAQERAAKLAPRLSKLRVNVPPDSRVPGLEITRDGAPLLAGQWNSDIDVDGGEYVIVARAPGSVAWSATVSVAAELDRESVTIPRLVVEAALPPPRPVDEPVAIDEPPPETPGGRRLTPLRKAAIGVAAVGAVALGGGLYFALDSSDKEGQANAICPTSTCNDPEGLRLNDQAQTSATRANMFLVGGGVALAGGAVMWLVGAPPPADRGVALTPVLVGDRVGLTFGGTF